MNEVSKIEMLSVDSLKPYERNARKHGEEDVAAIAESIKEFGFNDPIGIWGKENLIVEGHGRLMAAKELGMDKVPCIRLDHLTDEQRRAYALAHNRTAELSEWDEHLMKIEIADIPEIDFEAMGFEVEIRTPKLADWFSREEIDGDAHEEGNEEYNSFVDKFKEAKTTDDCYTPDIVYDAVAEYVAKTYKVDRAKFVRPFYPGGDYQAEVYPKDCVVVDNPPFSILSEIERFYVEHGVKFFIFSPTVTAFPKTDKATALCTGVGITYENGAAVNTSFLTNLEPEDIIAKSCPELYKAVNAAAEEFAKAQKRHIPKYQYPDHVVTAAKLSYYGQHDTPLTIKRGECVIISELDEQKAAGKAIYGKGLLLSEKAAAEKAAAEKAAAEKAAAEKAAAEKAAAERWSLSEREWEIVRGLGDGR